VIVGKQRIEEINQDGFIRFCTEDALKAEIGEETNVFILEIISHDRFG
jgi:hypothetical protein